MCEAKEKKEEEKPAEKKKKKKQFDFNLVQNHMQTVLGPRV